MKIKEIIKNVFNHYGYRLSRLEYYHPLESFIHRYYSPDFFFVQIGANDGKRFDPIYHIVKRLKLRGIAVEPIRDYYEELKANYREIGDVEFVNKAIYSHNGKVVLYRIKKTSKDYPDWMKGIASVNADFHKLSKIPANMMVEEEVECITFQRLLDTYKVQKIDLLQIDTEGYDYHIIKMIDFQRIKPRIVSFEHGLPHEIMTVTQLKECIGELMDVGYNIAMEDYNCIAYLRC